MRLTWYWDELDNFDRSPWTDIRSITGTDYCAETDRPAWLIVLHPSGLDPEGDPIEPVRFYGAPLSSLYKFLRTNLPPEGWEGWYPMEDHGDTFSAEY